MSESKIIEGSLQYKEGRFAIVVARFNGYIVESLLAGAMDTLLRHGVSASDITVVRVPGAFELPVTVQNLAQSGDYSAIIALGAVIRGATPHFEYVSAEVSKGIATVSIESEVPVIFGIITTDTIEQAIERAGTKAGNKGWSSAMSALEMANLVEVVEQA